MFFQWKAQGDKGKSVFDDDDEDQPNKMSKDMIAQKEEEERVERIKRAQLKRDQEMQEFQDKGGFSRVLNDIFNPVNLKSMELDSVFQIKKFCQEFYERKMKMS